MAVQRTRNVKVRLAIVQVPVICKDHLDYVYVLSGLLDAYAWCMDRGAELRGRYKGRSFQYTTAIILLSRAFASRKIISSTILVRNSVDSLILDIHLIFVCLHTIDHRCPHAQSHMHTHVCYIHFHTLIAPP